MKIGVLDSGIGGLSVLSSVMKLLPKEDYFYYADTEHVPYGEKTKEQIYEYTKKAVDFLLEKKCDIICIACNTATSVAARQLREIYDTPILGVEPAVKPALEKCEEGRILVLATPVTVHEKKLHDLIEKYDSSHRVDAIGLAKLPVFAEQGIFEGDVIYRYLEEQFSDLKTQDYSAIVLGCTHFIHYESELRRFFKPDILFLDGSEGTARNIMRKAENLNLKSEGLQSVTFYKSGALVSEETCKKDYDFMCSVLNRLS